MGAAQFYDNNGELRLDGSLVGGGGGTPAGVSVVRHFPFTYNSPSILTGFAVYTPTVGDILLDGWLEIDTAWDGTTPTFDFGSFDGQSTGIISNSDNQSQPLLTVADADTNGIHLLQTYGSGAVGGPLFSDYTNILHNAQSALIASLVNGNISQRDSVPKLGRFFPAKFTSALPLKVVVSQDGSSGGADPGSSHGAAILYLVTATPA